MEKYTQPAFVIVQRLSVLTNKGQFCSRCIVGGSDSLEEAEKIRDWFDSNIQPNNDDSEYNFGPRGYFNYEVMRP